MACFLVPVAEAIVVSIVNKRLEKKEKNLMEHGEVKGLKDGVKETAAAKPSTRASATPAPPQSSARDVFHTEGDSLNASFSSSITGSMHIRAMALPSKPPINAMVQVSPIIRPNTCPLLRPMARRRPISFLRSLARALNLPTSDSTAISSDAAHRANITRMVTSSWLCKDEMVSPVSRHLAGMPDSSTCLTKA